MTAATRQDHDALHDYIRGLNHLLQTKKVPEAERGFLLTGVLIALQDPAFREAASRTPEALLAAIRGAFTATALAPQLRDDLLQTFAFIPRSPALQDHGFLAAFIADVDLRVHAFMRAHACHDIVGELYVEFLRHANNDKGISVVLTPPHIADLFVELAAVDRHSVVHDNCCGTAGLLIAAMKAMTRDVDPAQRGKIKAEQLLGVEFQPTLHALAAANLLLHGDRQLNIHRADTFNYRPTIQPTVGLLNPPYKNKAMKDDREELEFVLNNLDALAPGGTCVAIVPITCATAPSGVGALWKARLLERHTLEAVLSMPLELFHNSKTTVVTCTMILTAHQPHPTTKQTWFAYCRHDGLIKTKHRGRVDANNAWPAIQHTWVERFRARTVTPGFSVLKSICPTDEWCAEAYLDADYATISPDLLAHAARRHAIAQVMHSPGGADDDAHPR
jgi:type I restriction enzyme M protein